MCCPDRIRAAALADRARRARSEFLPPEEPPDRDLAREYLRDGVGPAVALYREASLEGSDDGLSPEAMWRLDRALEDWLELYAACFGVFLDADASVSEAATILKDGRTLEETAERLTGVPSESDDGRSRSNVLVGTNTRSERG